MSQTSTQMPNNNVHILGIDPGYDRCGVAIIKKEGHKETLVFSTCITTSKKDSLPDRFKQIGDEVTNLFLKYSPSVCAIENLFFNTNQTTAMGVAGVRGILSYIARLHDAHVLDITPLQVKDAVVGHGHATKNQVQSMVSKLIALPEKKMLDDEYDAIAVALTASAIYKNI